MENNKGSKFLVKFLVFIIVILLIVISGGIGWYFGKEGKLFNNNNTVEEVKTSKKIDESKDWVYNAEYIKENKKIYADSAKTEKYAVNSDKDLVVPYININSEYAKTVNNTIKSLYDNYYLKYGSEKIDSYGDEYKNYYHYTLNYETHLNDNILSVIIKLQDMDIVVDGGTGGGIITLYTYNFNLDTLNEATLDEMAIKCGFTSGQEVISKIREWEDKQFQYLKNDNSADIFNGIQNDKYFIDENGKLNFIYKTSTSSTLDHAQPVEKDKEIEFFYKKETNVIANESNSNNENKIVKSLSPSGWAGSSMQQVRLYSNGEVYHIVYNGEGTTDDCIAAKELIAQNAEDIQEKTNGQAFEKILVKGKNLKVLNTETNWIEFEK